MRLAPLVLAVLCALVLFTGFARPGYLDWREARDAVVARENLSRREILTPLFAHAALFEKPLLGYVPSAIAERFWPGMPEGSRLLRALAALALLLVTASIGARHLGPRAGWIAAGVLASSLALPLAARTDGVQVLGALLGWAGAAGFADALFGVRGGRDARLVLAYVALAAAFLCAGPLPALWPLGGLALYAWLARRPGGFRELRAGPGLLLVAGLGLPWYGAMIELHGAAFLARAPFFPYAIEPRGAWYAGLLLPVSFLVVGFFPWSALLPGAIGHAATWWRRARSALPGEPLPAPSATGLDPLSRERREESAAHYFVACLLAALVPIALYPGPPLPAILPALPAAALLCARYLDHLIEESGRVARSLAMAVLLLGLVGSVGAVLLALLAPRLREAAPALNLLAAVVLVTSWAPFLANLIGRRRAAAALMALPVAFGTPVVALRLLPAMEDSLSARAVAEAMEAGSPPRAALVLVEPAPPSLRFYAPRNLVLAEPLGPALDEWRAGDGLAYVAFPPRREGDVAREARAPLEIMLRTPAMVLARVHARDPAR